MFRVASEALSVPPDTVANVKVIQATLDDIGTPLAEVTFVVVDLETTGGSAAACEITEIGAVKVRAGQVLGEFHTLVNPQAGIPPFIQVLTGITDAMVADAPRIETVLPAFLEFARGAVLVAHNAGFDVGFLQCAAKRCGHRWPGFRVVDTVPLARRLVSRDEAPNCRLGSLAVVFGAETTPDHRALHDARATVDVLHGLLGRVGNIGVRTLEELLSFSAKVTPEQRRKRVLADGLPGGPGVYVFRDANGRALYVGTSKDIRTRVRSYFTAAEQRTRMAHMVALAVRVDPIPCQTQLEAQIRELRLIAQSQPRFNRRSKRPDKVTWVKLTDEPFPRLSLVRTTAADGARYVGPFTTRGDAEQAVAAIHEAIPLRQCTGRISLRGRGTACALGDIGRCGAPCEGRQSRDEYAEQVTRVSTAIEGDVSSILQPLRSRLARLSEGERFEEAARVRDRADALLRGVARSQRLAPLARIPELVAAKRLLGGSWEIVCIRHGRFAGTSVAPRGTDPMLYVRSLQATAETVAAPVGPGTAAGIEEAEKLIGWLDGPDVRLVHVDGEWTCPLAGAGSGPTLAAVLGRPAAAKLTG